MITDKDLERCTKNCTHDAPFTRERVESAIRDLRAARAIGALRKCPTFYEDYWELDGLRRDCDCPGCYEMFRLTVYEIFDETVN